MSDTITVDKHNSHLVKMPLTIYPYDIDAAGHVNNVVYIRWLEDMRTKLISDICDFRGMYEDGYYLVVISTEIKYKKQLKIFDSPVGIMECSAYQHGILTLKASVKLKDSISATAIQKCVMVDLGTRKMIIASFLSF